MKILAKYVRVTEPEILSEVYQTYGLKLLQPDIKVDLEGVKGLLKGLGNDAVGSSPATFVDSSLVEQLEREGFIAAGSR
jgi:predicted transcriptional regulator with HTH domain